MYLYVNKNLNGKYEVLEFGSNKSYGVYNTQDEADEQIAIQAIANGNNPVKSVVGENLTISELDDNIEVSGYLLRYTNPQKRDLTKQWWSKKSYLMMEAGFPIVGAPIKMAHSLEEDFTRIGIGIVNFVTDDELGIFIKGQLHKREKWKKIVAEASKRRGYNLTSKQLDELAERAYENVKSVIKSVPLQWSMGSYPPTFKVDKSTGHIETAGIVEATLTPIPAEPYGTDVNVSLKNFTDSLSFIEHSANKTEDLGDDFYKNLKYILDNSNYVKGYRKMPKNTEQDRRDAMLKSISEIATKMAQMALPAIADEEKPEDEEMDDEEKSKKSLENMEQLKSFISTEIEKVVSRDTGFKNAETNEDISRVIKSIVDDNMQDFVKSAVNSYIDEKRASEKAIQETVKGVYNTQRKNAQEAPKSNGAGGYQKQITPEEAAKSGYVKVTKNEEGSLAEFFKQVALGIPPKTEDYTKSMKSQNPYIGTLGGFLVGQEVAPTILDPLRPKVVMFNAGVTQTNVSGIGSYTVNKMTTAPSAYRPGINQTISESEAKFDSITAFLRPLACRVVVPRQMLLTTGTNVEQKIRDEIIRSLRLQIDKEILEGVGNVTGSNTGAEIRGVKRVLLASGLTLHTPTLDTNGRKPKYDDLVNAETQIATQNVELDAETTSWVMHPRDRGTFRRTTDAVGQPLLYTNYSERPYEDLIGYRVHTTTQINNAQTTGTSTDTSDIYFGNWRFSEYVIGQDIEVIRDDMTLADALNVRFIVYLYSDFIVHYPEAFYLMRGVRA